MNSQGIIESLNLCIVALDKGSTELKTLGLRRAKAEKAYRIKQATEILKLKSEKYPATLILELVKGNEEVAELRLQRDIAESAYYSCKNGLENLRMEIEVLRSKLIWIRTELNNWKVN